MNNKLSRRQWALAAAAPMASAAAQAPPQPRQERGLEQARARMRQGRDAMKRFSIPAQVEPATVFRA